MKFPMLFGRTPSHRRFEYKPRFYDPQKEEREERERRIRSELALEQEENKEEARAAADSDYRTRIKGSFQRSKRRAKPSTETSPALLRLAVLLFITLLLIGYLTWGAIAFYSLFLIFPVWIYFRFLRKG